MYNKLSFIPFESLYPVRIALDDYEEVQDGPIVPKKNIIKNTNATKRLIDLHAEIQKLFDAQELSEQEVHSVAKFLRESDFFNLDSFEEEIASYIFQIIAAGEGNGLSNLECASKVSYYENLWRNPNDKYWMLSLLKKISICYIEDKDDKLNVFNPDSPSTEALGFYDSKEFKICLCPARIERIDKNHKIDLKNLYAIVLIHELAHAMMDPTNKLEKLGTPKESEQPKMSPKDSAMEESLANMITLQYFKVAKEKGVIEEAELTKVRDFMKKQPKEYKFGIAQEEIIKPDWRSWRDNKSTVKYWTEWGAKVEPYLSEHEKNYPDFFDIR